MTLTNIWYIVLPYWFTTLISGRLSLQNNNIYDDSDGRSIRFIMIGVVEHDLENENCNNHM